MLKSSHCQSTTTPPFLELPNPTQPFDDIWRQMTHYWWQAGPDESWLDRWENSLDASRDYYLASLQTQLKLASVSDQLVGSTRQSMLDFLNQLSQQTPAALGALSPFQSALTMGGCAYDSMSKATRQVSKFANTNLSAAVVKAVKHSYREALHFDPSHHPRRKP
ncbi:hypothetical protein [Chitinivorax sp. B]|uniref:hypothetical protein n=1 Tax=Chitinivorax sp. B TaxID=2502235 RepID=UPI0010F6A2EB|nr:hypothetical protein [Chitinivorax sp. B]